MGDIINLDWKYDILARDIDHFIDMIEDEKLKAKLEERKIVVDRSCKFNKGYIPEAYHYEYQDITYWLTIKEMEECGCKINFGKNEIIKQRLRDFF